MSRVLLVRHAEAGERKEWKGEDRARPLTQPGQAQALVLAAALDGQPLDSVVTSAYLRCLQTVEPLTARRGLTAETAGWLEEGADPAAALQALLARGNTLACTHGDVVSGILFELADRGVDLGPSPRMQKGSRWALEIEGEMVISARYLPPPTLSEATQPA